MGTAFGAFSHRPATSSSKLRSDFDTHYGPTLDFLEDSMLFLLLRFKGLLRLIKGCQRQGMWQPGNPILSAQTINPQTVNIQSFCYANDASLATVFWRHHPLYSQYHHVKKYRKKSSC